MQHRTKIFGPPGTGKTTRAITIVEEALAKGLRPNKFAFATFTRRARREAIERLSARFNLQERDFPHVRTIHSLCYRMLQLDKTVVMSDDQLQEFAAHAKVELTPKTAGWEEDFDIGVGPMKTTDDVLLAWYHVVRQRRLSLPEGWPHYHGDADRAYMEWFVSTYEAYKTSQRLWDFTDFLTRFIQVGGPLYVDLFLVDEAQDLSLLQWAVVDKMSSQARDLYEVGDDDQAIFAWAGADAEAFLERPCDSKEVLPKSWRLPAPVHALAQRTIHQVRHREPKDFHPADHEGEVKRTTEVFPEMLLGAPSVLILYRNHFLSKGLIEQVRLLGLPYRGPYSPFNEYHLDKLAAIYHWERYRAGTPVSAGALAMACGFIPVHIQDRFLKPGAVTALKERPSGEPLTVSGSLPSFTEVMTRIQDRPYLERVIQGQGLDTLLKPPAITFSTIHQAKGAEADTVVVCLDVGKQTYQHYETDPDSEHRVFYVAFTRAKRRLFLLWPQTGVGYECSD